MSTIIPDTYNHKDIRTPRLPTFRQSTPRMELVALIQAAQGGLLNLSGSDGLKDTIESQMAKRALGFLNQAQNILRQMPEGQWSEPETTHDR